MSNCTSGCLTKDHATWGECMRAKRTVISYCGIGGGDRDTQKRGDAELDLFDSAASQGVVPRTSKTKDIRAALDISDKTGEPFDAANPPISKMFEFVDKKDSQ